MTSEASSQSDFYAAVGWVTIAVSMLAAKAPSKPFHEDKLRFSARPYIAVSHT